MRYSNLTPAQALSLVAVAVVILAIFFVPVKTKETHVRGLTWAYTTKVQYTETEIYPCKNNNGDWVTCTDTDTITVAEATARGDYTQAAYYPDVPWPTICERRSCRNNYVNQHYVHYVSNDVQTEWNSDWEKRYIGQPCKIYLSVVGTVVHEKCGDNFGR